MEFTDYINIQVEMTVPAIDRIRAKRLKTGRKLGEVDKSSLMRETFDLLTEKGGVLSN